MTKQKLIQYLNAASDAEAAVYYYEESIGLLRQKLSMLEPVQRPADAVKPKPLERKRPFSKYFAGFWIAGIADVVVIVGFLKSMSNDNWGYRLGMSLFGIPLLLLAGFIAGCVLELVGLVLVDGFLGSIFDFGNVRKQNREMLREWEEGNDRRKKCYEEACRLEAKAKKETLTVINELTEKCKEMKKQRSRLYDMNVLHVAFRNMIAVNQIRDYLEMGICNELEGANGAYALYMQDVRANRICASIEELRKSVEKGFENMMQTMAGVMAELMKTNSAIRGMRTAIESGIGGLQRLIYDEQASANERYQASMREANGYLKNIQTTLSEAAHNEYIALKESNVSGYLHRM